MLFVFCYLAIQDENGVWLYHEGMVPTDNGYWVEAKDLRVGDVFLGANGKLSTLTNKIRIEQEGGIAVFNFTVEGNHNYFVLARDFGYGQSCVLVHNAKFCGTQATDAGKLGELKAGINKNTEIFNINGRDRIPDEVTDTMITEVKNVKKQHLSTQIKDYIDLADQKNKTFRLERL